MSIWKITLDIATANLRSKNTLVDHLGIEFIEVGNDYLKARMPVGPRVHQPLGIMHGGASCVLAETVGSTAANFCVDPQKFYCVGLSINTSHIRSIKSGEVIGTAKPFHLGKSTQVWGIDIVDAQNRVISVSRLTMAVLSKATKK